MKNDILALIKEAYARLRAAGLTHDQVVLVSELVAAVVSSLFGCFGHGRSDGNEDSKLESKIDSNDSKMESNDSKMDSKMESKLLESVKERKKERTKERKKENIYIYNPLSPLAETNSKMESPLAKQGLQNGVPANQIFLGQFCEFWGIFPRREAKGAALRAYKAALKRASHDQIMEGARRYAAKRLGQDKRYTCMASTWLNQDRWLDEDDAEEPKANSKPKFPMWAEVKEHYVAKYGRPEAFKRYCDDRESAAAPGAKIILFPGGSGGCDADRRGRDALVCGDDESQEGGTSQEKSSGSGLLGILPALQAMDNSQEN